MKLLLTSILLLFYPNCIIKQKEHCPYEKSNVDLDSSIKEWRSIEIGGIKQYISIRGKNKKLPVLLFLHGGPGTPETPFLAKYNDNLENEFIVASWEQRGSGRSYNSSIPPDTMTIKQLVNDTIEVTEYLKIEFNQDKIYMIGHSWGTVLGILASKEKPNYFHAYIGISQLSNYAKEEEITYRTTLKEARKHQHSKAIQELESIRPPNEGKYDTGLDGLKTRLKWSVYFGGGAFHSERNNWKLINDVIFSNVYGMVDKISYLYGEEYSLDHLFDEMMNLNLEEKVSELKIPVYFLHGSYDNQIPISTSRNFFQKIKAPEKEFIEFEKSAHGVLYEEPEKFLKIMKKVKKTKFGVK